MGSERPLGYGGGFFRPMRTLALVLRDAGILEQRDDMVCLTVLQGPLWLLLVDGGWGSYRQKQGDQLGDYCVVQVRGQGLDQVVAAKVVGTGQIKGIF